MKSRIVIFSLFIFCVGNFFCGNDKKIDSLLIITNSQSPDSIKSVAYFHLYDIFILSNPQTALVYLNKSILLYPKQSNPVLSRRFLSKSTVYRILGQLDSSVYYCNMVMDQALRSKNHYLLNMCYREFGLISITQNNYSKAIEYFNKQLDEIKNNNLTDSYSGIYNNIGIAYGNKGDWDMAGEYFRRATKDDIQNNRVVFLGNDYNNLGIVYMIKHKLDSAKKYFLLGLDYRKKQNDMLGICGSINNLALLEKDFKNYPKALQLADSAFNLAKQFGLKKLQVEIYDTYDQIYSATGNYKKAYEYINLKNKLNSTFEKEETKNKIQQLESDILIEQKQTQILEKDLQLTKSENQKQKQTGIIFIGTVVLIALLIFLYTFFKNNKTLKGRNKIITEQKQLIEEKHKDITDSINYAQKIQSALIISEENLNKSLKEAFVIFKPRDIVSGDFYWFTEHKGVKIVAMADCTGHGVPGAFMSMIGMTLLNKIVNEKGITSPAEILNNLRVDVIKALNLNSSKSEKSDGMDMSLIAFTGKELLFAGANSYAYLIHGGELIELRPNKQPIGVHIRNEDYTEQKIELKADTKIYLFSDGITDQFGGEGGKKVKSKQFKDWLLSTSSLTLKEQKAAIEDNLESWKKGFEQTDDISLIGIKLC